MFDLPDAEGVSTVPHPVAAPPTTVGHKPHFLRYLPCHLAGHWDFSGTASPVVMGFLIQRRSFHVLGKTFCSRTYSCPKHRTSPFGNFVECRGQHRRPHSPGVIVVSAPHCTDAAR